MTRVFHASKCQDLKRIVPMRGTHRNPWIYAAPDVIMSSVFLSTIGGDFTCSVGRDGWTGRPFICERLEGALGLRYGGQSGSLYTLPADGFVAGLTAWPEEVVSTQPVVPLDEIKIDDVYAFLLWLEQEGKLLIKRFPEKARGIPDDDGDLVQLALTWARDPEDPTAVCRHITELHPHLVRRVVQESTR